MHRQKSANIYFVKIEARKTGRKKKVKWSERTHLETRTSEISTRTIAVIFWDTNIPVLFFSHLSTWSTTGRDPYDFQQYIDTTNNKTLYFLYAYHVPGTEKGHYSTLFHLFLATLWKRYCFILKLNTLNLRKFTTFLKLQN